MLPKTLQWILLKSVHDSSPLERDALTRLVEKLFSSIGLSQIILEIMNACNICHHITSRGENLGPYPSSNPFKEEEVIWRSWKIDFTHMPSSHPFQGGPRELGK